MKMIAGEAGLNSDVELVHSLKQGNSESIGSLYKKYFPKVYHTCYIYSGNHDDAFDLAQDVLMKTFSRIDSFEETSTFSTWLFSITRNHCLSHLSRRKKELCEDVEMAHHLQADDMDAEEFEERLSREAVESEMGKYLSILPLNDKRILELKYRYNFSIKDLQREFGLSASAIKMRLLRSRQKAEQVIKSNKVQFYSQLAS